MHKNIHLHDLRRVPGVYVRALRLIWAADPRLTGLVVAMSILSAIAVPAQVWITKMVIDRISGAMSSGWQALLTPLALYLVVWVLNEYSQSVSRNTQQILGLKTEKHAQYLLLQKASALDIAFYETSTYYDQMELAGSQVWRFSNVPYFLLSILTQAVSLISLFILLGRISIWIPTVLLLAALPRLLSQSSFTRREAQLFQRRAPDQRMSDYLASLLAERAMVKEIRLFGLQTYLLNRFRTVSRHYTEDHIQLTIARGRANLLFSLLSLLGTGAAWAYAITRAILGRISLGDVVLVFQGSERSRFALDQLFFYLGMSAEYGLYLGNFFAFLDLSPDAVEGALASPAKDLVSRPMEGILQNGAIEFRHVSFRYPQTDRFVLQDISCVLHPGQATALVGENGAGKTTLVKLLARLYDPTEGQILVNGHDLREFDPQEYYRQIGVIFQDFAHYDLTARENIALGNVAALDDAKGIHRAAGLAGALPLIEGLPHGFDTMLGKRFEGGVDLSGGEWQKLGLARAFMRDTSLLILDEPTAALDVYAEHEVYNRFADLTHGKTTVFVTHRFSSVKMAQHILVLKDGHLIEQGDHAELLELGGEYAEMYKMQAVRYK